MRDTLTRCLLAALLVALAASCGKETRDERFLREAREFTQKQCPKRVDPGTVMDSLTFDPEARSLTYDYTVSGALDADSLYTDELLSVFHEKVLREIKTSIPMKPYKDAGLSFVYRYTSDRSGARLLRLEFTPADYR